MQMQLSYAPSITSVTLYALWTDYIYEKFVKENMEEMS